MDYTEEQLDILVLARSTSENLMISALAGTGKSSTLLATERRVNRQPILYLVFNTDNAMKIMSEDQMAKEKRKPNPRHSQDPEDRCLSTTTVRTLNSMGHRIWMQTQSQGLKVDGKKSNVIMKDIIDKAPANSREALWSIYHEVIAGVAMAKALGYVPEGPYPNARRLINRSEFHAALEELPDDLTADLIDLVLKRSIKQAYDGLIDYNDQVYMPALFGGTFPKFPLILADEYQDFSPVNHALLERLVKARLIGVGDPFQNIYGFRGAHSDGMRRATERYACTSLPLSISFRCPSEIVKHVHWRVPTFRWSTEGGSVERPERLRIEDIPDEATIICRNNAPLFACAMRLLSGGRSIAISGSDIGPRLVGIMRKLGPETLGREGVVSSIEEWRADRLERESKTANDMADCMRVFASHGKNLREAIAYAEHLFKQQGRIQLTTGHKAKGLEWTTVYHLDPFLVRRDPHEQNKNLDYVISTRSRDRLIEIETEQLEF